MSESSIQTNRNKTDGKRLKTFESKDAKGEEVHSSAVTFTNGKGKEIHPATEHTMAQVAAAVANGGTLQLGDPDIVVTSLVPVRVFAANAARGSFLIQNNGDQNLRVGPPDVTPTRGIRVEPGLSVAAGAPLVPTNEIWVIAEAGITLVAVSEVVRT